MDKNQSLVPLLANLNQQLTKGCCSTAPCPFALTKPDAPLDGLAPALGHGDYYSTPDAIPRPFDGPVLTDQTTSNQDWGNDFDTLSMQNSFSTTNATVYNGYDNFDGSTFRFSHEFPAVLPLEQDKLNQPNFQPTIDVATQASNFAQVAVGQTSSTEGAVILVNSDGLFFCSEPGCDTTYLRKGDCQRHLKKHNGPFFPCTQPGCDMTFYRADKQRDHLKQGHDIIVAAPPRRRH
ncbi:metal ion binding [Ascochyta rabiei]|uniref:Metal ion binding n=1 Tax=Didymella rabiei TaxID=5454 RepID=A0A163IC19_DIDRA|nr:metal ion binding [Ascochyta rabiei]